MEEFDLSFAFILLRCVYLEKRIHGLLYIRRCVDVYVNPGHDYMNNISVNIRRPLYCDHQAANILRTHIPSVIGHYPNCSSFMLTTGLLERIQSSGIIDILFGTNMHVQLLRRATHILKAMSDGGFINESALDMILTASRGKHETVTAQVVAVLISIIQAPLPMSGVLHVMMRLAMTDIAQLDSHALTLIKQTTLVLLRPLQTHRNIHNDCVFTPPSTPTEVTALYEQVKSLNISLLKQRIQSAIELLQRNNHDPQQQRPIESLPTESLFFGLDFLCCLYIDHTFPLLYQRTLFDILKELIILPITCSYRLYMLLRCMYCIEMKYCLSFTFHLLVTLIESYQPTIINNNNKNNNNNLHIVRNINNNNNTPNNNHNNNNVITNADERNEVIHFLAEQMKLISIVKFDFVNFTKSINNNNNNIIDNPQTNNNNTENNNNTDDLIISSLSSTSLPVQQTSSPLSSSSTTTLSSSLSDELAVRTWFYSYLCEHYTLVQSRILVM